MIHATGFFRRTHSLKVSIGACLLFVAAAIGIASPAAAQTQAELITPADGATYQQHETVLFDYTCSEGGGGRLFFRATGEEFKQGEPVPTNEPGVFNVVLQCLGVDGTASEDSAQYTVVAPSSADISVDLTASVQGVLLHSVNFTAEATNTGPGVVDSAQITFRYPAGFVSPSAPGCVVDSTARTATCDLTNVDVGVSASRTLNLTVGLLTVGDPLTVTAARVASSPTDPEAGNDTADASCSAITAVLVRC